MENMGEQGLWECGFKNNKILQGKLSFIRYTAHGRGRKSGTSHPFNPYAFDEEFICFFQGEVIAMDKIANKVKKIKQNAELLQLNCIKAFCYDGTKALSVEKREDEQGKVTQVVAFRRKQQGFAPIALKLPQVYKLLKSWQIPKLLQHCEFIYFLVFCDDQLPHEANTNLKLSVLITT